MIKRVKEGGEGDVDAVWCRAEGREEGRQREITTVRLALGGRDFLMVNYADTGNFGK